MELVSPPFANNVVIEISREPITWQSLCSKETHLKQRWHTHPTLWSVHRCFQKQEKGQEGKLDLKGNYSWNGPCVRYGPRS